MQKQVDFAPLRIVEEAAGGWLLRLLDPQLNNPATVAIMELQRGYVICLR